MVMFWVALLSVEYVLTVIAVTKSAESPESSELNQSENTGSDAGAG